MVIGIGVIEGAAVGYIAGAFTPAIGRKIKALFVKEGAVVKADASAAEASAKSAAESAASKI